MTFESKFQPTSAPIPGEEPLLAELESWSKGLTAFMARYSGCVFQDGLYRVHPIASMRQRSQWIADAFPQYEGSIFAFGSDWQGRQFAIYTREVVDGERQILMVEPGTGDAYNIPCGFMQFHDAELIESTEALTCATQYLEWREAGGAVPGVDECIGLKTPLFIGGKDSIDNMELSDMDVYWTLCGQIRAQI